MEGFKGVKKKQKFKKKRASTQKRGQEARGKKVLPEQEELGIDALETGLSLKRGKRNDMGGGRIIGSRFGR